MRWLGECGRWDFERQPKELHCYTEAHLRHVYAAVCRRTCTKTYATLRDVELVLLFDRVGWPGE